MDAPKRMSTAGDDDGGGGSDVCVQIIVENPGDIPGETDKQEGMIVA
jgi:hypothetical protein